MTYRFSTPRTFAVALLLSLLSFQPMAATPVGPMNYQGRLLDDAGIPVTGSYDFVVKIYDAPTVGILKYQETHSNVAVEDGVYAFKIGVGPATTGVWDIDLWQNNLNDLFLEVVVNGETLTPRHELTSAPHAFTATLALSAGALGNKTAAEYDNILEGVCAASKGKWLDNIGRCLGVAATITNENAATMASDLNYNDLDLSKADITNTLFANANFSNTVFKNTTLTIGNFSGANLTGARLDSVTSTNSMPNMPINLTNATITNTSLSGWNLSSATVTGLSAANLSACPSALPANWFCAEMKVGSGTYFLFGPGANLSTDSAAAIAEPGILLLNVDDNHFAGKNLSGANFKGIDLSSIDFTGTNLSNANLNFTSILYGKFDSANLSGASFQYSQVTSTLFTGATFTNNNFTRATIISSTIAGASDISFEKASLKSVTFNGATSNINFSKALLDSCNINGQVFGTLNLSYTNFRNGINFADVAAATVTADNITTQGGSFGILFPSGTVINNLKMTGAQFYNQLNSVTFNNCIIDNSNAYYPYGTVFNSAFNNCQITATSSYNHLFGSYGSSILSNTTFNGGVIAGPTGQQMQVTSDLFLNTTTNAVEVAFSNVAMSNMLFKGNWSSMPIPGCSGCTFTNTSWDPSASCPGEGSPVETPAASGIYQCAGWY